MTSPDEPDAETATSLHQDPPPECQAAPISTHQETVAAPSIVITATHDAKDVVGPLGQHREESYQVENYDTSSSSTEDWHSTHESRVSRDSIDKNSSRAVTLHKFESPNTSTSLRLETDKESELSEISTSSVSFSGAEEQPSSPENLVFGTEGSGFVDRKEKIEESIDDLVDEGVPPPTLQTPDRRTNLAGSVNEVARAAFNRNDGPLPLISRRRSIYRLPEEHSEITDFGGELHYKHRKSRSYHKRRSKTTGSKSLQDRLFESLEPVNDETKDKGFFPLDQLPVLLTEQSVHRGLKKHLKHICEPDEIADLARKICSEKRVDSFDECRRTKIITYRKIFAILVLIEKTPAIRRFVLEGVNDSDLPFVRSQAGYSMRRARAPNDDLKCFQDGWTPFQIRNFEDWQWTTLAPFFAKSKERKEVRHYPLQDRVILPFLFDNKRDEVDQELLGGGGRVFKATIHPDHHNFHDFFKCPRASPSDDEEPPRCSCDFAIKCLHSQDKESFKKEVDMLKRFSNNAHPNLISLLATYEHKRTFFLVFPRAEEDLRSYWTKTAPPLPMDAEGVCWVAEQCLGIAKGVLKIHEYESSNSRLHVPNMDRVVGNHGDIKPENVLWFRNADANDQLGRGTLKLSDFGLADLSSRRTASRRFHSRVAVTCNYRAPECDIPDQGGKGRQYDMWTLGCLYLEFVAWLVGGAKMLEEFTRERMSIDISWYNMETDTFFQVEKEPETGKLSAIVKPAVTEVSLITETLLSHQ